MASQFVQALHSLGLLAFFCSIMAPKPPRFLQNGFVVALGLALTLSCAEQVVAQFGVGDLPPCASTCASTAANATGCKLNDTACLCSHPAFASATEQCAGQTCPFEDQSTVFGVLSLLCANQSSTSSSAAPSSTPAANKTTSSAPAPHTSQTSQTSPAQPSPSTGTTPPQTTPSSTTSTSPQAPPSPSTPAAAAPTPATTLTADGGLPTTNSGSSTVVVVQTVTLPQTSSPATANAVLRSGMASVMVTLAIIAVGWMGGAALL